MFGNSHMQGAIALIVVVWPLSSDTWMETAIKGEGPKP